MSRKTWRCFHCDEVFRREIDAAEHFGSEVNEAGTIAACQIKGHENNLIRVIREQEHELARYCAEDSEIMRAMESLQAEHADALRRAEDLGFGRGVQEMQALAEKQFGVKVDV